MAKIKKKLTAAQKRAKAERQRKYEWVFINGKQVRMRRPQTVCGMSVDEFIEQNADPIWLHQNGLWELMPDEGTRSDSAPRTTEDDDDDDEIPF